MDDAMRSTVGYALLGFAIGMFLFPWIYLVLVRMEIAALRDSTWMLVFFALVLVPALLFAMVGRGKPRSA